ncbi:MAG TPA: transcription antitermination factor NusB [Ilumatobacteraceae bacterium]|nr:transcription antitermination factor NusB [Ilumatobacteraceae bacterium]
MTTAREVAYRCLQRIDHDGAFANLLLQTELARSDLSERDRGFVTDLVYGTTRMRRACDAMIDRFLIKDPKPALRTLLRLGAYQLGFAGVSPHAAVGETVALAPKGARGFVNAVLRRIADTPMEWPDNPAVRLSYPDWIVRRLRIELGRDADAALERMNLPAPVSVREDGYTQDLASQWVAAAVETAPGERILDLCAAPGGKATAMAQSGADVIGADLQLHRVRLIHGVPVVVADAAQPAFAPCVFDKVLVDAPCSGLGALRRRADARWRVTEKAVSDLAALQRRILDAAAELVRPGGWLVYSVCTLTAEESIDHAVPMGFEPIPDQPSSRWRTYGHGWRILPQDHDTDGMILIRYRRIS